jgi:hypothetical protein
VIVLNTPDKAHPLSSIRVRGIFYRNAIYGASKKHIEYNRTTNMQRLFRGVDGQVAVLGAVVPVPAKKTTVRSLKESCPFESAWEYE